MGREFRNRLKYNLVYDKTVSSTMRKATDSSIVAGATG